MEESLKNSDRDTKVKIDGELININCMNSTEINNASYKLYS